MFGRVFTTKILILIIVALATAVAVEFAFTMGVDETNLSADMDAPKK
jgi:hypothetical protein